MLSFTSLTFSVAFFYHLHITILVEAAADYKAAVFEYAPYGTVNDSAPEVLRKNLFFYEKATTVAKSKGADIIVFPEYGIFPAGDRQQMKKYLENIPDPKKARINPCEEPEAYSDRIILRSLSCMAKNNSIYMVVNMGDIQDCEGDPSCRPDGVFQFNTNVVFDRNGTLVLKYHKEHLYFEEGMDLAREQQDPTFETEFGTFATYICFDIIFDRMREVAQRPPVDGILFTTMWYFLLPQYISVQTMQAWAIGNNATIIGANTHILKYFSVGSGIFHGEAGALAYSYNPDGISKLVVAHVPQSGNSAASENSSITAITENDVWEMKNDGKDVPLGCTSRLRNGFDGDQKDYSCAEEKTANYTFVKLTEPSGHVEACNNGMCCALDYTATEMSENFYLGVYNGTHNSYGRYFWCEENCVLVRCEAVGDNPCATFPMKSKTVFRNVELRANFSTQYIYPSVVNSGMRLAPRNEWKYEVSRGLNYEGAISYNNREENNFIVAGFKGRCFDRDPPYIR